MNGWTAVLPLVGVVIGATMQYWLSRSAEKQRQREWLRDNKKQEWRELIGTLSRSVRYILDNSFGLMSGEQQKGLVQANAAGAESYRGPNFHRAPSSEREHLRTMAVVCRRTRLFKNGGILESLA
jgi:hypothetical protein